MANLFFKKEKASQTDAMEGIDKLMEEKCPEITYLTRFTSELLDTDHPILVIRPVWMGWRSIIMKVPIGYIDGILLGHRAG